MPAPYLTDVVGDAGVAEGAAAPTHPDVIVRRGHLQSYPESTLEIGVKLCFCCGHFGLVMTAFVLTVLTYIRVDEIHATLMPK
jgi:hypothetical protein